MIVWKRHINSKAHAFLATNEMVDMVSLCGKGQSGNKRWLETQSLDRCAKCERSNEVFAEKARESNP